MGVEYTEIKKILLGFKNGLTSLNESEKLIQERMYSEEEVLNLLYMLWEANPRNIKEWFEQIKKK